VRREESADGKEGEVTEREPPMEKKDAALGNQLALKMVCWFGQKQGRLFDLMRDALEPNWA
jgi:hypothetical protein